MSLTVQKFKKIYKCKAGQQNFKVKYLLKWK